MSGAGIVAALPVDPAALAGLDSPERGRIYKALGLDRLQIASCEDAVRLVRLGQYAKARRV